MSKPTLTDEQIAALLRLTSPSSSAPNINELWRVSKDITAMKYNLKFFGYELAKALLAVLPPLPKGGPFESRLSSKPATQADLESNWCRYWSAELKHSHIIHRKHWELAFVLQALWQMGKIRPAMRGLNFGRGEDPIISYLCSKGCEITLADLSEQPNKSNGAPGTTVTHALASAFRENLVERATFDRMVSSKQMSSISSDPARYDFCWSISAADRMGSIQSGIDFIEKSVDSLKPGGVAIHTTEFNFTNDSETIDNWPTVLFQRRHLESTIQRLEKKGCRLLQPDFDVGSRPLDRFIDIPPFPNDMHEKSIAYWWKDTMHIKLSIDGFPSTSFGLIAVKN